jgi:hypothetical protein
MSSYQFLDLELTFGFIAHRAQNGQVWKSLSIKTDWVEGGSSVRMAGPVGTRESQTGTKWQIDLE